MYCGFSLIQRKKRTVTLSTSKYFFMFMLEAELCSFTLYPHISTPLRYTICPFHFSQRTWHYKIMFSLLEVVYCSTKAFWTVYSLFWRFQSRVFHITTTRMPTRFAKYITKMRCSLELTSHVKDTRIYEEKILAVCSPWQSQ